MWGIQPSTLIKGALVGGFAGAVGSFVGGIFNPLAGVAIYVGGALLLVLLNKVMPG